MADPTPPVPGEPYLGAAEVRKLALNTFWPIVQERADQLDISAGEGIDSRLLAAINRGLYATGAAAWAAGRTRVADEIADAIEASVVRNPEERYGNCTCLDGVECHPHACHRVMNGVTSRADEDTWPVVIASSVWVALDPLIRADAARVARQVAEGEGADDDH